MSLNVGDRVKIKSRLGPSCQYEGCIGTVSELGDGTARVLLDLGIHTSVYQTSCIPLREKFTIGLALEKKR